MTTSRRKFLGMAGATGGADLFVRIWDLALNLTKPRRPSTRPPRGRSSTSRVSTIR